MYVDKELNANIYESIKQGVPQGAELLHFSSPIFETS